jgi:hypothetical protein
MWTTNLLFYSTQASKRDRKANRSQLAICDMEEVKIENEIEFPIISIACRVLQASPQYLHVRDFSDPPKSNPVRYHHKFFLKYPIPTHQSLHEFPCLYSPNQIYFASSGLPIVSGIIPRNRRRRRRHLRPLRQLVPADPGVFLQIRIREVRLLPPALLAGDQALSGACQGSLDEIRGLATTNLCLLGCGFRLG